MKRLRQAGITAVIGLSSMMFSGCPATSLMKDCFGEGIITPSEYDDLNFIEKQGYEKNGCGMYEPSGDWLGDLINDIF